jgi:hypothetical protein
MPKVHILSQSPVLSYPIWVARRDSAGLRAWLTGFDSRQGLGIFLFTTASSPALGATQPPIQWVPGAFSLKVKRPGREADHSPPFRAEVKQSLDLYFHSPNTPSRSGARLKKAQGQLYLYSHSNNLKVCV